MRRSLVASLLLAAAAAALWLAMPAAAPPAPAAMANEPTAAPVAAAPGATAPIAVDATPVDGPASATPAVARQAGAPLPVAIDDFAPEAWRQHVRQVGDGDVEVRAFVGTTPLANAAVTLHERLATDGEASWPGAGALLRAGQTDADGRIAWRGLNARAYVVRIEHDGKAATATAEVVANDLTATQPETATTTLVLFGTAALHGSVRDANDQPVADARIGVLPVGALPAVVRIATTDAAGAFRCEGLPPGDYDLTVQARSVRIAGAQRRVTLRSREVRAVTLVDDGKR